MILSANDYIQDPRDAAQGLRDALAAARACGADEVHLAAGVYELRSSVWKASDSIAHDDGCGELHGKACNLLLEGLNGLVLSGETDESGAPATVLAGCHENAIQSRSPTLLWADGCTRLTLKNLAMTRSPVSAWAGEIASIQNGRIAVRLNGGEAPGETGAYCMNRIVSGRLTGESLTNGFGYDRRFRRGADGLLELCDPALARKLQVGDGLSWHQSGLTDFLLFFGNCTDLKLENIRIFNANAFAMLTENCRGIHAQRLVMKPGDGRWFTGPRDGWKVYRCGGHVHVEDCWFEGFRMDGQNVHANYLRAESVRGDEAVFACKYAPIPLQNGSAIRVHLGPGREALAEIRAWEPLEGRWTVSAQKDSPTAAQVVVGAKNHIARYAVRLTRALEGELRAALEGRALCEALCWTPESYVCERTVFCNIAGAGNLLRCENARIEGNRYDSLMNAGVLIGAELDTHEECGHGRRILIRGNTFEHIGFKPRYGAYGCAAVAVKSEGFSAPVNEDIRIEENVFADCACAIELNDAQRVTIRQNRYDRIETRLRRDERTTREIRMEDET